LSNPKVDVDEPMMDRPMEAFGLLEVEAYDNKLVPTLNLFIFKTLKCYPS